MASPSIKRLGMLVLLLVGGIATSCDRVGYADATGPWVFEQERRGDTTIVRTISGSVWGDTMQLVPEVGIGVMDGSPAEVFGRIASLDLDGRGRLLVLDAHAREVRVFSGAGEHLASFGGHGGGPGEFQSADFLRATPDGHVVVRDQAAARFSVFDSDGNYLGGWPRATGFGTNAPFYVDGHGRVINPSLTDRLLVYGLDGTPPDTIPIPGVGYEAPRLEVVVSGGTAWYDIPFMPGESWTIARDGRIVTGVSNLYAVDLRDPNGPVLRIERRVEPVPVTDGEASQARDQVTRSIRASNDPNWRWRGPDIPATKPMFQDLRAGLDGTVWVFREGLSNEEPNPNWDPGQPMMGAQTLWVAPVIADVFDSDGRYLGPVEIPRNVAWAYPHPVLSKEMVWAATIHEAGFPQVVRYDIQPKR